MEPCQEFSEAAYQFHKESSDTNQVQAEDMSSPTATPVIDLKERSTEETGREIGRGRSGSVTEGKERINGKRVAVKKFNEKDNSYEQEKKINSSVSEGLGKLESNKNAYWWGAAQHFVPMLEYNDGNKTMSFELIEGNNLRSSEDDKDHPASCEKSEDEQMGDKILKFAKTAQVANAFAALAKRDIIHYDVHPANILHDQKSGLIKLVDFGRSVDMASFYDEYRLNAQLIKSLIDAIQNISKNPTESSIKDLEALSSSFQSNILSDKLINSQIKNYITALQDEETSKDSLDKMKAEVVQQITQETIDVVRTAYEAQDLRDVCTQIIPKILFNIQLDPRVDSLTALKVLRSRVNSAAHAKYSENEIEVLFQLISRCLDRAKVPPTFPQISAIFELLAAGVEGSFDELFAMAIELRPTEFCYPIPPAPSESPSES